MADKLTRKERLLLDEVLGDWILKTRDEAQRMCMGVGEKHDEVVSLREKIRGGAR